MTKALCFNCGHTKLGAICSCEKCNAGSTGDMDLDIAFSDHQMSAATIAAFGNVIRAIGQVCEDDQLRFWSFIRFISVNHPQILGVQMPPERQAECDVVLTRANPPAVQVEQSERARYLREHGGEAS